MIEVAMELPTRGHRDPSAGGLPPATVQQHLPFFQLDLGWRQLAEHGPQVPESRMRGWVLSA